MKHNSQPANRSAQRLGQEWLNLTRKLVRRGEITIHIPITLTVTEWAQVAMIAGRNEMEMEQVVAHIIRNGGDLLEIANQDYVLEGRECNRENN